MKGRRGNWRGLLVVVLLLLPELVLVHLARLQTNVTTVRPAQASLTMDRLAALSSRIECPGRHEQWQGTTTRNEQTEDDTGSCELLKAASRRAGTGVDGQQ